MEVKDSPVNGTSASGLPAAERLVSLGRSGPIARRRFPETPLTPCGGNFLTSVQTVSQSAGPGASVPCVRHGSQAADIDRRQLVYPSLERRCGRRGPARVRPSRSAGETGGGSSGSPRCVRILRIAPGSERDQPDVTATVWARSFRSVSTTNVGFCITGCRTKRVYF